MAEQVKAADAPAPALSFGNFASKVESPSGGFNFKAPEFNTGNQGLFGAPTKFGESTDKKDDKKEEEALTCKETFSVCAVLASGQYQPVLQFLRSTQPFLPSTGNQSLLG